MKSTNDDKDRVDRRSAPGSTMSKERFETFSDGVIAIAITLLVLELKVPHPMSGSLLRGFAHEWPSFAAYFVSFFTIGIFWINHHLFFRHVSLIDHTVVVINVVLLLWVSLWPFTTAVLAEYMRGGVHQFGATMAYVGVSLAMAVTWTTMYRHIRHRGLLDREPSPAHERYLLRRNSLGFVGYLAALPLGLASAAAALGMCALVALYYLTPAREEIETGG